MSASLEHLCIIFQDDQLLGYVSDEASARTTISELADRLISELQCPGYRVFSEKLDSTVNIYSQAVGSYFNGPVSKQHTVSWQTLPKYTPRRVLNLEI